MKKLSILATIAVFLGFLIIPAWAGDPAVQVQHGPPPALVSPDQSEVLKAVVYPAPPAGFNPAAASVAELEEYGFPPRPVPTAPNYTQWLHMVTMPQSRITNPKLTQLSITSSLAQGTSIGTPSGNITPATNCNWSGYGALNATGRFKVNNAAVFSTYVVPVGQQAHNTCDGTTWYSSQWVGFDGLFTTPDVLQAGTYVLATCTPTGTIIQPYSFYEWYPASQVYTSLAVNPGDIFSVAVWYTSAPPNGHAYLLNETTGLSLPVGFSPPAGTSLVGDSVEWILEKVGGCSGPNLDNYGQDTFLYNSASVPNVPLWWWSIPLVLAPGLPTPPGTTMYALTAACTGPSQWYPSANCPTGTVLSTPELYGPFTILFSNSPPSF